jgi:hypothetical protein
VGCRPRLPAVPCPLARLSPRPARVGFAPSRRRGPRSLAAASSASRPADQRIPPRRWARSSAGRRSKLKAIKDRRYRVRRGLYLYAVASASLRRRTRPGPLRRSCEGITKSAQMRTSCEAAAGLPLRGCRAAAGPPGVTRRHAACVHTLPARLPPARLRRVAGKPTPPRPLRGPPALAEATATAKAKAWSVPLVKAQPAGVLSAPKKGESGFFGRHCPAGCLRQSRPECGSRKPTHPPAGCRPPGPSRRRPVQNSQPCPACAQTGSQPTVTKNKSGHTP